MLELFARCLTDPKQRELVLYTKDVESLSGDERDIYLILKQIQEKNPNCECEVYCCSIFLLHKRRDLWDKIFVQFINNTLEDYKKVIKQRQINLAKILGKPQKRMA